MAETGIDSASKYGRALESIASVFVLTGGGLLSMMSLLVVVSVLGRLLFSRPVPGDFEIVAIGTAISAFLSLPYCHLKRGNVSVDLFLANAPVRVRATLDGLAAVLFGGIALVFAWRMSLGLKDVLHYRDVTMILGIPVWLAYPFGIASFGVLALSCAYTALRDLKSGRS